MGGNFLLVLGVCLFVFFAWVSVGGPSRAVTTQGPYLTPVATYGDRSVGYFDDAPVSPRTQTYLNRFRSTGSTAVNPVTASAFHNLLSFSRSTIGPRKDAADEEYVIISLSTNAKESVSLAGWSLKSSHGRSAYIPDAVELPREGRSGSERAVVLRPGDSAIIVTGRSPIETSFRENICVGYLAKREEFSPFLSGSCPLPKDDLADNFHGSSADEATCKTYVTRLPRCEEPASVPTTLSSACRTFIEDYASYDGCVSEHKNDSGFSLSTWRLYLERRSDLWESENETITLLDASGKTVDVLSY